MKPLEILSLFKLVEAVPAEVIPPELKSVPREALTGMIMMITVAAENVERTQTADPSLPLDVTPHGVAPNSGTWSTERPAA